MAIDPTISLANLARRKSTWDPGATYDRAMSLIDLTNRRRIHEAALKQSEIEQELSRMEGRKERRINRAMRAGGTPTEIARRIATLPGGAATAKKLTDAEASNFDAQKAQIEQQKSLLDAQGSLATAILRDPQRYYGPGVRQGKQLGWLPKEYPEDWSEEYSPQLETMKQTSMSTIEQLTQQQKKLENARTLAAEKPKLNNEWWDAAAKILGVAADETEWGLGIESLQAAGIPPHMVKALGQFSPENRARIESIGMTPQERAAAAKKTKTEAQWTEEYARGKPEAIAYFKAKRRIATEDKSATLKVEQALLDTTKEDYKFWEKLVVAANRRLTEENQSRLEWGDPMSSIPSGTELFDLEQSQAGPGPRRWGAGAKMPLWLAQQYFEWTKGDKREAVRMAQADGWDVRK